MAPTILDVQKFWDARPCNIMHGKSLVGSPEYMYETEARKYRVEPHIPGFAEFDRWADKDVLEIGCGIGVDTANFVRAGARVTAVDLSIKSVDIAVRRILNQNSSPGKCNFWVDDAEHLNFKPNLFDLAYAFGSIHHSPDPAAILQNARHSIRAGGTLKLMVYNKYSWKSLWILLKYGKGKFWKFSELIARYSEAQTGCPITHVFSKRSIRKLVESAGFRVKSIKVDHVFKWDIAEYVQYRYKVVWYFRWMPDWLFRLFERSAGWHILVEATA